MKTIEKYDKYQMWSGVFDYVKQSSEYINKHRTTVDAITHNNHQFNRYPDILPYDQTRVKLVLPNRENTDYINANLIKVPQASRTYIASQNPVRCSVHHFWQMVWEQNCRIIVMLNKLVERNSNNSYWPLVVGRPQTYGNMCVTIISEVRHDNYIERVLEVSLLTPPPPEVLSSFKGNVGRTVKTVHHLHFEEWADFEVPLSSDLFVNFIVKFQELFDKVCQRSSGCVVVHCSAGVGRTGTFILIDSCLRQIKLQDDVSTVDPVQTLIDMREQRMSLVQTSSQLQFAYKCIAFGVELLYPHLLAVSNVSGKRKAKLSDSILISSGSLQSEKRNGTRMSRKNSDDLSMCFPPDRRKNSVSEDSGQRKSYSRIQSCTDSKPCISSDECSESDQDGENLRCVLEHEKDLNFDVEDGRC